jgi:glycosyltransferase involved in cell wall biosynthesis
VQLAALDQRDTPQPRRHDQTDPARKSKRYRRRAMDVVLPVLNEAGALPWILGRVPVGDRAIVVDNGSSDGSADIARAHGATVVDEPRRGFGAACWAGLVAADDEIVCFMDADASLDPADLHLVAGPIERGEADLVLGRRRAERGAWPVHARLANRYLAREVSRRTGVSLRDLGPMRAARREALLALGIEDRRFGWPLEMVLRASRAGWRIVEVDVPYRPRTGRSKVTGTVRGTAQAVRDMRAVLAARL